MGRQTNSEHHAMEGLREHQPAVLRVHHGQQPAGTAFTVAHRGRRLLVTAGHLVPESGSFAAVGESERLESELTIVAQNPAGGDTAAYELVGSHGVSTSDLRVAERRPAPGERVYYFGFPGEYLPHLPLPSIRSGIVSNSCTTATGASEWVLDGMSSPGCSGGPVVYFDPKAGAWKVFAVLSRLVPCVKPVALSNETGAQVAALVPMPTGFFLAADIGAAIEAIDAQDASAHREVSPESIAHPELV